MDILNQGTHLLGLDLRILFGRWIRRNVFEMTPLVQDMKYIGLIKKLVSMNTT